MKGETAALFVLATALLASGCTGGTPAERPDNDTSQNGTAGESEEFIRYVYSLPNVSVPEGEAEAAASVARVRLSYANISAQVRTVNVNGSWRIRIYTRDRNHSRIDQLMKPREFRAVFNYTTAGKDLQIEENHSVTVNENSVTVSGRSIGIDETTEIGGTTVELERIEDGTAHLLVKAYGSESVNAVLESSRRITGTSGEYSFRFQVALSQEAAERVRDLAQNFQTVYSNGQPYLGHANGEQARLYLQINGETISPLAVSSVFKRQLITQPSIMGSAENIEKARKESLNLIATLKSGELPVELQLLRTETVRR